MTSDIGQFNNPPINPYPNNLIIIEGPLEYTWQVDGVTNRFTIPSGFVFDGASIPLWATLITKLLPFFQTIYPYGIHLKAAAFHDYIWMYKGRLPAGIHVKHVGGQWVDAAYGDDGKPVWTFKTSNKLFARHLRELGVGKKERRTMYLAVSTPIGWWNWRTGSLPVDAR